MSLITIDQENTIQSIISLIFKVTVNYQSSFRKKVFFYYVIEEPLNNITLKICYRYEGIKSIYTYCVYSLNVEGSKNSINKDLNNMIDSVKTTVLKNFIWGKAQLSIENILNGLVPLHSDQYNLGGYNIEDTVHYYLEQRNKKFIIEELECKK